MAMYVYLILSPCKVLIHFLFFLNQMQTVLGFGPVERLIDEFVVATQAATLIG